MKPLEFKITEEALQALFQGKKVVFDYVGLPRVTLIPPRHGVFMADEDFRKLEKMVYAQAFEKVLEMLTGVKEDNTHKENL